MAKIMIVDDSTTTRLVMKKIIEGTGKHTVVAEAADGEEAMKKYGETKPDVVTMDISMPKMNGIETVRAIIKAHPDAKIIMVSAVNKKDMVITALKCGAKSYILKPIKEKKLLESISKVLENPQKPGDEK